MATPNWIRKMGGYDICIMLMVSLVSFLAFLGLAHKVMGGSDQQQEYFGRAMADLTIANAFGWLTVALYRRGKKAKAEKQEKDKL